MLKVMVCESSFAEFAQKGSCCCWEVLNVPQMYMHLIFSLNETEVNAFMNPIGLIIPF